MTFKFSNPYQYMLVGHHEGRLGVWNFHDMKWANYMPFPIRELEQRHFGAVYFGTKVEAEDAKQMQHALHPRIEQMRIHKISTWVACIMCGQMELGI